MAFLVNILWLNIKKLRLNLFWKIVFVLINMMLFGSTLLMRDMSAFLSVRAFVYLFLVVTLSNTLFAYIKITSDTSAVSLFRAMGASRSFIVINNMVEVMLLFIISLVLFAFLLFFYRANGYLLLWSLTEMIIIMLEVLIFSLFTIHRAEKIDKAA